MESAEPGIHVAIIGAGIVGVTLAHALLERSISVSVYEASSTIRTTGGGINATEAGVRALKACGPKCYEAFVEVGTRHHLDRPELFWSITQGDRVAEVISEGEYGSMPRIKFLEALALRLPVGTVELGNRIKAVRETEDRVELEFESGAVKTADVVLGCDGIHSEVKGYVVGDGYGVSFSHSIICRGLIPTKDVEAIVGEDLGKGSQLGIGHGDGTVWYPVSEKVLSFGYYYHEPDPWPHWPNVVNRWTREALLERMQSIPCDAKHLALVKLFPSEITQWGIWYQENPLPTYSKGRIAILGDAAHATSPYLGSGAGQGYEDAAVCAALLQVVNRERGSQQAVKVAIEKALLIYSDARRERSQHVVSSSFEAGRLLTGAREDFDKAAEEYARLNYEIWDYDLREAMELAVRRLSGSI